MSHLQLPFDRPGRFWRGNLHLHSTRSDGTLSPADVIAAYRAQGYDFVALTDHFLPKRTGDSDSWVTVADTAALRTDDFTTILGAELHGPGMANGEWWHLVAVGLPLDFPRLGEGESGAGIARRAVAAGAYVAIAHPTWNQLTEDDARQVAPFVHAVEVYNHGCAVEVDRGDGWALADQLVQAGHRLGAIATDDAHFQIADEPDAFGGWVNVRAESLDPDALLAALHAGHFYASTGMTIENVVVEADHIVVTTPPAYQVFATGNGARSHRVRGGAITEAVIPLDRFREHGWVRITVVGPDGTRAWTNPIWL